MTPAPFEPPEPPAGARTDEPPRTEPHPSAWPFALAGGVTLLLFGLTASLAFTAAGGAVMAIAIAGWIQELRRP